jgi:multisubunit Na+/H+ antiporter MnhB subunit
VGWASGGFSATGVERRGAVWLGGAVGAGAGVAVAAGVASLTLTTGVETPGIVTWSAGVPGGTSTVTVTLVPPSRVTTSVRLC